MCKTFDLCTLLRFLCSFCDRLLFRFQHWVMVETVFVFMRFIAFWFWHSVLWILDFLVYVDLDFQILFFVNIEI